MTPDVQEIVLKIVVAGALGALVGLDRELSDQPAGLRTHILVSLGAALFTMAGAGTFTGQTTDPTRVAAQVVTGIGFLGAGAILRQGFSVRGLTTAAGLWVTAAVGTAVGLGYWYGAVATSLAAVIALFGLKRVERKLLRKLKPERVEFIFDASAQLNFTKLAESIESRKVSIHSVDMEAAEDGAKNIVLQLKLPPRMTPQELAAICGEIEGVNNVEWRR